MTGAWEKRMVVMTTMMMIWSNQGSFPSATVALSVPQWVTGSGCSVQHSGHAWQVAKRPNDGFLQRLCSLLNCDLCLENMVC